MPSINFKEQFAEAVKNGTKRQTIRQVRKNPIKPGDMLTMFTGQRTKECRKLCMHKCKSVYEITIYHTADDFIPASVEIRPFENGPAHPSFDIHTFAMEDGFSSAKEFYDFFKNQYGGLCFKGVLIKW